MELVGIQHVAIVSETKERSFDHHSINQLQSHQKHHIPSSKNW